MLRHPSDWKYFMDLFYCCCHLRLFVTDEIITPGSGWGKHYMTSSAARPWNGLPFLVFDTVDHKHHLWHSGWNLIIISFAKYDSWESESRLAVNLRHRGGFFFVFFSSLRCTVGIFEAGKLCVRWLRWVSSTSKSNQAHWPKNSPELKQAQIGNSCYHEHTFTQPLQILHWFGNVTWIHWEVICIYQSRPLHILPPLFLPVGMKN